MNSKSGDRKVSKLFYGGDYMSEDAKQVLELFENHLSMLEGFITDKNVRRDKFDRYSYSITAIRSILNDIYECTSYKDVSLIRQILRLHEEFYSSVVDNREKPQRLFVCALNATRYLYSLTGGYVYD